MLWKILTNRGDEYTIKGKKGIAVNKQELGKLGETVAANYLEQRHYHILERNYRCKLGEIDLIAIKDDKLHFVEVKTRSGTLYGHPAESITRKKRNHMENAAKVFLSSNRWMPGMPQKVQFDAIEVEVTHIENI